MLDKIKTTKELASYLGLTLKQLREIDPDGSYASFYVKKPGSSEKRLIEYPKGDLARVLDRLCDGLQWLYLDHITASAYGYIRKVKPCNDPRDIYTNAQRHLGKKYLLNIDLDNFFHQIDTAKLSNLFSDLHLFSFDPECEQIMVKLVSYHGRLPMGSPTSPPLSNFATIALDKDLEAWVRRSHFVYTRFVDDLSFSSNMKISQTHFDQINEILVSHRFVPDPLKIKFFVPGDVKEVTGLIISDKIGVPDEYLVEFNNDLERFRNMHRLACTQPDSHVFEWLDKMKQILNGRLAFLKMVHGANSETYLHFRSEIDNLYCNDSIETSISWRYAGYEYC